MNIFKKFFSGHKKKENKVDCWYNNVNSGDRKTWSEPMENVCSQNSVEYTTAQQIAKTQM